VCATVNYRVVIHNYSNISGGGSNYPDGSCFFWYVVAIVQVAIILEPFGFVPLITKLLSADALQISV